MPCLFLRFNGSIPRHLRPRNNDIIFNRKRLFENLSNKRLLKVRHKNSLQREANSLYPSYDKSRPQHKH